MASGFDNGMGVEGNVRYMDGVVKYQNTTTALIKCQLMKPSIFALTSDAEFCVKHN